MLNVPNYLMLSLISVPLVLYYSQTTHFTCQEKEILINKDIINTTDKMCQIDVDAGH
jgi:hypothetical protein